MTERDKEVIAAAFGKLGANICPHCDAKIERQQQIGHSVYAHPCGHRLYQGTVGAFAPQPGEVLGG